jgi:hypothetical protein
MPSKPVLQGLQFTLLLAVVVAHGHSALNSLHMACHIHWCLSSELLLVTVTV